jgi:major vault protein
MKERRSDMEGRQERDLVLAPNEFAFILDETKGNVTVYVGPNKTSLANTDKPVIFSETDKIFERTILERAVQTFKTAPEGWYIILKNPSAEGGKDHPTPGSGQGLPSLNVGRKVNIRGPVTFPLWPGQMARVTQGHHLKSNQYLLVRVYDDESARENWDKGVMKPAETGKAPEEGGEKEGEGTGAPSVSPTTIAPETPFDTADLTMGKLLVIKGTDVSFYIPPTGVEVVRDKAGNYVRSAVTLERLEYCILLNEDGNKRYVRGPDVVFPEPTETFLTENGERKFRAIELNNQMGLHIKVIADYEDEEGTHKTGEELFLTGADSRIYFPRPEHAIIKYGNENVHFAVAIPGGEARYVLNKDEGKVETVKGPEMFLPDPRRAVIVRRVLPEKIVKLLYPGNNEAVEHNRRLATIASQSETISEEDVREAMVMYDAQEEQLTRGLMATKSLGFKSDDFSRQTKFTQPRMLTLDTKYDGAVIVQVWTGYAIQLTSKTGSRRVVVGPKTVILDYDEIPETISLSTGKPKNTDNLRDTGYLRVSHNKVSDIIRVETKDLVEVDVKVSYRVNFEGDSEKWFAVENYVKFLCDHLRSIVKNAVKHIGVEEFNKNPISIVRDAVIGGEEGERPGRLFEENGMRVYDVEVLDVQIRDDEIAHLLKRAEQDAVSKWLTLAQRERELEVDKKLEAIEQESLKLKSTTRELDMELKGKQVTDELVLELAKIKSSTDQEQAELDFRTTKQEALDKVAEAELARSRAKEEQTIKLERERLEIAAADFRARVEGFVKKAESIQPGLVEALTQLGDKALLTALSEHMSPMAILGGRSVIDVAEGLAKGTGLEGILNGSGKKLAQEVRDALKGRRKAFADD